jgi:Putative prokaryotic signal transducing protein
VRGVDQPGIGGTFAEARIATSRRPPAAMKELLRTNDVVRLSWAQARLKDAGIDSLVLDHHTSLVEGSIGAIPRRLMVGERDHRRAQMVIAAAEEELR